MPLCNLPEGQAASLAGLVTCRAGQVSSMALARGASTSITLLAFSAGESVSEETYPGDTLYQVVEGAADIVLPDARVRVAAGEVMRVSAGVLHAVEGHAGAAFKLLQLTLSA